MKTLRNITILIGLSALLFALAATGARAQTLALTSFNGRFTLPLNAQWGAMALPAGDYSLSYGQPFKGGIRAVTVAGKAEGSPRGMILAGPLNDVKAAENVLLCVREGDKLYVRALELPAISESVHFKIPHGVEVRSTIGPFKKAHNQSGKAQFTQVAIRIERALVK